MSPKSCRIGSIHSHISVLFTSLFYQLWQHQRFQFAAAHYVGVAIELGGPSERWRRRALFFVSGQGDVLVAL